MRMSSAKVYRNLPKVRIYCPYCYLHTGTGSQLASKAALRRAYGPKAAVLLLQALRGTVSQPQCHAGAGELSLHLAKHRESFCTALLQRGLHEH